MPLATEKASSTSSSLPSPLMSVLYVSVWACEPPGDSSIDRSTSLAFDSSPHLQQQRRRTTKDKYTVQCHGKHQQQEQQQQQEQNSTGQERASAIFHTTTCQHVLKYSTRFTLISSATYPYIPKQNGAQYLGLQSRRGAQLIAVLQSRLGGKFLRS